MSKECERQIHKAALTKITSCAETKIDAIVEKKIFVQRQHQKSGLQLHTSKPLEGPEQVGAGSRWQRNIPHYPMVRSNMNNAISTFAIKTRWNDERGNSRWRITTKSKSVNPKRLQTSISCEVQLLQQINADHHSIYKTRLVDYEYLKRPRSTAKRIILNLTVGVKTQQTFGIWTPGEES